MKHLVLRSIVYLYLGLYYTQLADAQVLQNLVRNANFEQYKELPIDLGAIDKAMYCNSPTTSTADYFHKRAANPAVRTPRNKMGIAEPRSGNCYAGFYAYTSRYTKRDFREYVQFQFKQALKAGDTYCVKAHVYLSQSSNRALPAMGVCLSKYAIQKDQHLPLTDLAFTYLLKEDKKPLTDRAWVEISTQYKALGGETYLIIGNFHWDKDSKVTSAVEIDSFLNPNVDFAYYFIDDVCVTNTATNFDCDCGKFDDAVGHRERIILDMKLDAKSYPVGEPVVLSGIKFEKNKALFLPESHQYLDDIVAVMNKNPTYEIEISGHTDDKGDPEENHFLSKRRAKSVVDYLVASGISEKRLTYRGFGQSRPVALNDSPENRAKNERVQLIRLK